MTNHKELAEDHYDVSNNVSSDSISARHIARAQYHATMALLEQQKLANEIAAISQWSGESAGWPYAIKEGLGL